MYRRIRRNSVACTKSARSARQGGGLLLCLISSSLTPHHEHTAARSRRGYSSVQRGGLVSVKASKNILGEGVLDKYKDKRARQVVIGPTSLSQYC